jgi:hypothetical protein
MSGSMHDGHFDILTANKAILNGGNLLAPVEASGKNVLDTISVPSAAAARDFTLNATHLNSVYYITGARATNAQIIRLPNLNVCNPGDKITFYLSTEPNTVSLDIMQAVAADKVYGAVPVYAIAGDAGAATDVPCMAVWAAAGGIRFITGVTGANVGTTVTFTCIGGKSTFSPTDTTPADDANALPVSTTVTKNWHISGFVVGDATSMTGAVVAQGSA